jgi:hypothetical protein
VRQWLLWPLPPLSLALLLRFKVPAALACGDEASSFRNERRRRRRERNTLHSDSLTLHGVNGQKPG